MVVNVASAQAHNVFEESCLDEIKLARKNVPAYNVDGTREMIDLKTLKFRRERATIARMIERKKDRAITRVYMKAAPNQVAKRITAQAEVVKEMPTTWTHRSSLMAGL